MNALQKLPANTIGRPHRAVTGLKPWRIESIDPLVGHDWDIAASDAGASTVFHTAAWARVLVGTYGHIPHYLRVWSGERMLALVPIMEVDSCWTGRRGVCLPFSDGCGPLWAAKDEASTVYDALASYAGFHHWNYLEIRDDCIPPDTNTPETLYSTHSMELRPGGNRLWRNLAPAVRRSIRKAERAQVEVSFEIGAKAMVAYHRLHAITRRRHGLPPQPQGFFLNLSREVIESGNGFIALATLGRTPIAGAIFLYGRTEAIYKFGASDHRHWGHRPNQLVMWTGISRIVEQTTCASLNFGRTCVDNSGLNRFKDSFGAYKRHIRYYRYSDDSAWRGRQAPTMDRSFASFRRCPLFLNEIAGTQIYRHLD